MFTNIVGRFGCRIDHTGGMGTGGGGGGMGSWKSLIRSGSNLRTVEVLKILQVSLKPVFDMGKTALAGIPLGDRASLAAATHNAYFEGTDKLLIEDKDSWVCDPLRITAKNIVDLKKLLTPEGQVEAGKFVDGTHIGKAFIVPSHISPDRVNDFLLFFGKDSSKVLESLQQLVNEGNAKKKVINNQSMSWKDIVARCHGESAIYKGSFADAMLVFEASLQDEAVLDSAIAMAALELGLISEADIYSRYHELWATHNDWQAAAKVNYVDLELNEQQKDNVILDAHRKLIALLRPVIDSIKG